MKKTDKNSIINHLHYVETLRSAYQHVNIISTGRADMTHWTKTAGSFVTYYITLLKLSLNFIIISLCISADYITPCSRKDPHFNECALKHGREAIPRLLKGRLCVSPHRLGRL
jgi:hypothetical protein